MNRTVLEGFYQVAFHKKIYHTIDELQIDLDHWLWQYKHELTHSGKYCFGMTPFQTFQETKHWDQEKMLDTLFPKEVVETVNVLDLDKTNIDSTV